MPKYKLVIQKKDDYNEILWNKIENYQGYDINKLENIIKFTGFFVEEEHLKETLLKNNLITESQYNGKLSIIYRYNKQIKKLHYGITYSDDLKFFDIEFLRNYLKSMKDDLDFLTKFCNHYRNSYSQGNNIVIIRNYINYINLGEYCDDLNELKNSIDITIDRFINKEVFNYDEKKNETKISYKKLRDLAMFLAYDYRKNNKEEIKLIEKEEITEEKKVKVKKKTKKKNNQIEGQYSLKDFGVDI